MQQIDGDLYSVQEARILVENAREAQRTMAAFPQSKLDKIVECMAQALCQQAQTLARLSAEETGHGVPQNKTAKNLFVGRTLAQRLRGLACVGVIKEDETQKTWDVGVPMGVVAVLTPSVNPVSTTAYNALVAVKSGNAAVFSPHPLAQGVTAQTLDLLISAAESCGLPPGALGYLKNLTQRGSNELMSHRDTALILVTGDPVRFKLAKPIGKPVICGSSGNGPVFIERTADVAQAVEHIVNSKTFDNGVLPATELAVVVDQCVAEEARRAFARAGAHFLSSKETAQLEAVLFLPGGKPNAACTGKDAVGLARMANIRVPAGTKLLLSEQQDVSGQNPFTQELLCPVMPFYVEDGWIHACEKCIELLVSEGRGHTLTIHSKDTGVIREFALKKPVSRILVNTPAAFGAIGATTNLFPALTLGSGAHGEGITPDNVSPRNLIHIRKVAYGVREFSQSGGGGEREVDNSLAALIRQTTQG